MEKKHVEIVIKTLSEKIERLELDLLIEKHMSEEKSKQIDSLKKQVESLKTPMSKGDVNG